MCRKSLSGTSPSPLPGSALLRMARGETIHIGPDIRVRLMKSNDGRAQLSISAPRSLSIDREKNLTPSGKSDGQGAPTPQPSCQVVPSSTKIQE